MNPAPCCLRALIAVGDHFAVADRTRGSTARPDCLAHILPYSRATPITGLPQPRGRAGKHRCMAAGIQITQICVICVIPAIFLNHAI